MDDLPVIESRKEEVVANHTPSSFFLEQFKRQETSDTTLLPGNERSNERKKVRHTFDILADQLLALREIAIEREKVFGKRVLLGELAQEALDRFIAMERNKP